MEELNLGDKITLEEKEFLIIEKIDYNEKIYLHLLDVESKNAEIYEMRVDEETKMVQIREENDEELKAEILIEILEKNKDIEI